MYDLLEALVHTQKSLRRNGLRGLYDLNDLNDPITHIYKERSIYIGVLL